MQEWLNWHAWKACVRATVPWVLPKEHLRWNPTLLKYIVLSYNIKGNELLCVYISQFERWKALLRKYLEFGETTNVP